MNAAVLHDPERELGWCVTIEPETTVVELAALMTALALHGRRVGAHHVAGGQFILLPLEVGTPPPSGDMLAMAYEGLVKPCALLARPNRPLSSMVLR